MQLVYLYFMNLMNIQCLIEVYDVSFLCQYCVTATVKTKFCVCECMRSLCFSYFYMNVQLYFRILSIILILCWGYKDVLKICIHVTTITKSCKHLACTWNFAVQNWSTNVNLIINPTIGSLGSWKKKKVEKFKWRICSELDKSEDDFILIDNHETDYCYINDKIQQWNWDDRYIMFT